MESISDLASQIISGAGQTPSAPAGAAGSPDVSEQALNDMGISQEAVDSFILEAVEAAPDCAGVVKETTSAGGIGVNLSGGENAKPDAERRRLLQKLGSKKHQRHSETFSTPEQAEKLRVLSTKTRNESVKKTSIYEALSVKKKKNKKEKYPLPGFPDGMPNPFPEVDKKFKVT